MIESIKGKVTVLGKSDQKKIKGGNRDQREEIIILDILEG